MNPTFSIIIPVYNVAPYLRECLDSVLAAARTLESKSRVEVEERMVEIICVDDGSTDGSGEILNDYSVRVDTRTTDNICFRVMHQANAGVSAARNAALDVATGEWIWFVDGDDLVRPEALDYFRQKIGENPGLEMLALKDVIRAEKLEMWPILETKSEWRTHGAKEYLAFHNGAWTAVFRRSILNGLRIEPFAIGEDVLFFAILFWRAKKLLVVDVPLYFYRQRPSGASMGNVSVEAARDNLEIERRCLELIKEHRAKWQQEDLECYFEHHAYYLLKTNMNKFMHISDAGRRQVLSTWLAVQRLALELGEKKRFLRMSVVILSTIRSGWLARRCVELICCEGWCHWVKMFFWYTLYPIVVLTRPWRHRK